LEELKKFGVVKQVF